MYDGSTFSPERIAGGHWVRLASLVCVALMFVSTTGCMHSILATGIYLWQGGNVVPAQCAH